MNNKNANLLVPEKTDDIHAEILAKRKKELEGTPESYITPIKGNVDMDALGCILDRARAITNLLHCQVDSAGTTEKVSSETLSNALWAIDGYLDQIEMLTLRQQ